MAKLSKQEIEEKIKATYAAQQAATDWTELHRLQGLEKRYELMLFDNDRPETPGAVGPTCPLCFEAVDLGGKSTWNHDTFYSFTFDAYTHTDCTLTYLDYERQVR